MALFTLRKLHRRIAPLLFLPLLLTALTGIAYRLGKSWFGMSDQAGDIFMVIHQGEYLGAPLKPIYVLLTGLGMIGLIVTGLSMTGRLGGAHKQLDVRQVHRIAAPIVFLPLVVSVLTGVIYRLGKSWFGLSAKQAEIFMVIHQGEYLGNAGKAIYVLLVGLGLITMLATGINMSGIFRQRRQEPKVSDGE
jgi:uncharacterized iron-regulated membrane protein